MPILDNAEITLAGPSGQLQALTTWPSELKHRTVAIICHPNPQQQGTMHNKVVTTLMKAYDILGMPTVRFNYRGVGKSEGSYGEVTGEIEDALAVAAWAKAQLPGFHLTMAGFSFGGHVAMAVASQLEVEQLVTIAPAVHYQALPLINIQAPWLCVMGEADEVIPVDKVKTFMTEAPVPVEFQLMPETGHFFHGKLIELREIVVNWLALHL